MFEENRVEIDKHKIDHDEMFASKVKHKVIGAESCR